MFAGTGTDTVTAAEASPVASGRRKGRQEPGELVPPPSSSFRVYDGGLRTVVTVLTATYCTGVCTKILQLQTHFALEALSSSCCCHITPCYHSSFIDLTDVLLFIVFGFIFLLLNLIIY